MVLENDQRGLRMRAFLSQPNLLRLGEVPFALAKTSVCNQSGLRLGEGMLC